MSTKNIHPVSERMIDREQRQAKLNQRSVCLWFTGLSGSGKSTIAIALENKLFEEGFTTQILDGDNIRTGISNNLRFSMDDRTENIRRIAEVSKLFVNAGIITINSFVSPTAAIRAQAKEIIGQKNFIEIFVNTPLAICEARDVKGLYKKARAGEIKNFTGLDAPFEAPNPPDIEVETEHKTIEESMLEIYRAITDRIRNNE